MRVRNSSPYRRTFTHLANKETGSTLELGPGEEAEADLPDHFTDPHLVPVKALRPSKAAVSEETALSAAKES